MTSVMAIIKATLSIILLPFYVRAHMQMSSPFPINSQYDPAVPESLKDYSYTSPLLPDGSNFPCKGYQTQSTSYTTKASYVAGSTYQISIVGGAQHDGGSCQLSLSYDNGLTWKVIKSMIGGCPITTTYDFTIPSFAPSSSSTLLAWTWFNLIGNREMYMNCARVEIQGSSPGRYRRNQNRRQDSMGALPDTFVCNVGNDCQSIEQQNVVFPNPGNDVIFGTDTISTLPGSGFRDTSNATTTQSASNAAPTTVSTTSTTSTTSTPTFGPFSNMSATSASKTSTQGPVASSTTSVSHLQSTTSFVTPTSILFPSTTVTAITASTSLPATCTPGETGCNTATTWSQCVKNGSFGTYVYMGSVAAGMQCTNGQIVRQNDGPCSSNGQIYCNGETAFYMCVDGGLISMGSVAPGTACRNGQIVYER